jgi:hypothetical protein
LLLLQTAESNGNDASEIGPIEWIPAADEIIEADWTNLSWESTRACLASGVEDDESGLSSS